MPFLDSDTCAEGRGGGYLFLPGFSSLYDAIHGWMMGQTDGWTSHVMKKASQKTTTTSFTICNKREERRDKATPAVNTYFQYGM